MTAATLATSLLTSANVLDDPGAADHLVMLKLLTQVRQEQQDAQLACQDGPGLQPVPSGQESHTSSGSVAPDQAIPYTALEVPAEAAHAQQQLLGKTYDSMQQATAEATLQLLAASDTFVEPNSLSTEPLTNPAPEAAAAAAAAAGGRFCPKKGGGKRGGQGDASKGNGKSAYRGVFWDRKNGRWRAQVGFNNRKIFMGYFGEPAEAARAYDKKVVELHGALAKTNFPLQNYQEELRRFNMQQLQEQQGLTPQQLMMCQPHPAVGEPADDSGLDCETDVNPGQGGINPNIDQQQHNMWGPFATTSDADGADAAALAAAKGTERATSSLWEAAKPDSSKLKSKVSNQDAAARPPSSAGVPGADSVHDCDMHAAQQQRLLLQQLSSVGSTKAGLAAALAAAVVPATAAGEVGATTAAASDSLLPAYSQLQQQLEALGYSTQQQSPSPVAAAGNSKQYMQYGGHYKYNASSTADLLSNEAPSLPRAAAAAIGTTAVAGQQQHPVVAGPADRGAVKRQRSWHSVEQGNRAASREKAVWLPSPPPNLTWQQQMAKLEASLAAAAAKSASGEDPNCGGNSSDDKIVYGDQATHGVKGDDVDLSGSPSKGMVGAAAAVEGAAASGVAGGARHTLTPLDGALLAVGSSSADDSSKRRTMSAPLSPPVQQLLACLQGKGNAGSEQQLQLDAAAGNNGGVGSVVVEQETSILRQQQDSAELQALLAVVAAAAADADTAAVGSARTAAAAAAPRVANTAATDIAAGVLMSLQSSKTAAAIAGAVQHHGSRPQQQLCAITDNGQLEEVVLPLCQPKPQQNLKLQHQQQQPGGMVDNAIIEDEMMQEVIPQQQRVQQQWGALFEAIKGALGTAGPEALNTVLDAAGLTATNTAAAGTSLPASVNADANPAVTTVDMIGAMLSSRAETMGKAQQVKRGVSQAPSLTGLRQNAVALRPPLARAVPGSAQQQRQLLQRQQTSVQGVAPAATPPSIEELIKAVSQPDIDQDTQQVLLLMLYHELRAQQHRQQEVQPQQQKQPQQQRQLHVPLSQQQQRQLHLSLPQKQQMLQPQQLTAMGPVQHSPEQPQCTWDHVAPNGATADAAGPAGSSTYATALQAALAAAALATGGHATCGNAGSAQPASMPADDLLHQQLSQLLSGSLAIPEASAAAAAVAPVASAAAASLPAVAQYRLPSGSSSATGLAAVDGRAPLKVDYLGRKRGRSAAFPEYSAQQQGPAALPSATDFDALSDFYATAAAIARVLKSAGSSVTTCDAAATTAANGLATAAAATAAGAGVSGVHSNGVGAGVYGLPRRWGSGVYSADGGVADS